MVLQAHEVEEMVFHMLGYVQVEKSWLELRKKGVKWQYLTLSPTFADSKEICCISGDM